MDFNLLQMLHKQELSEVSRWWKDLDFVTTLPYARDRAVECYFWTVGVYAEPQYSQSAARLFGSSISGKDLISVCEGNSDIDQLGKIFASFGTPKPSQRHDMFYFLNYVEYQYFPPWTAIQNTVSNGY